MRIMRDSRNGSYATMGGGLWVVAKCAALARLGEVLAEYGKAAIDAVMANDADASAAPADSSAAPADSSAAPAADAAAAAAASSSGAGADGADTPAGGGTQTVAVEASGKAAPASDAADVDAPPATDAAADATTTSGETDETDARQKGRRVNAPTHAAPLRDCQSVEPKWSVDAGSVGRSTG